MFRRMLLVVPLTLLAATVAHGQDAEAAKTLTVEPAPFRVVVDLPGVFESESMTEIRLRPREWAKLVVKKVLPQGTRVAEGEPVLWLETDEIDDAIRDAEFAVQLGKLSLAGAQSELKALEDSVPLDLEAAERAKKHADEDLAYYQKVGEEQSRKNAEETLKMFQERLEYAQEELNQLEKMYKADDLTEETEEIILVRTRRDMEHAKVAAESAKLRYERDLQIDLPRERINIENTAVRQNLALQKARATLPPSVDQKKIELDKLVQSQKQLERKLALLQADRELLTVKSPVAGVVRYGECERGKWTTAAQLESQLREGGAVTANQTVLTIVSAAGMIVRVEIPEAQLSQCIPGKTGVVVPTAYPELRLPATLDAVNLVAVKEGTYDGRVSFASDKLAVTPGMAATVKLSVYSSESAISVPSSAVFSEESDDSEKFVYLAGDKPEKRSVKVGLTKGDRIEVRDGLKAGDKILLEKPKS